MPEPIVQDFVRRATEVTEPFVVDNLEILPGGVDPLGLRQINFQLMDLVLPGLNNVARRIRPFTVIAWAWRRANVIFRASGQTELAADLLIDFVDRIEVLFLWSQLLRPSGVDLPGREALTRFRTFEHYRFGGDEWETLRKARRYSTALSAPVNYGPAVKVLGWIDATPYRGIFIQNSRVDAAVNAFERRLGEDIAHPAFSQFGDVDVEKSLVERWSRVWDLDSLSSEEKEAMRQAITDETRSSAMARSAAAIADVVRCRSGSVDERRIRIDLSGSPSEYAPSTKLTPVVQYWRNLQARQLFRLSLEALLYWITALITEAPRMTNTIAAIFLDRCGNASTTDEWLAGKWNECSFPERIQALQDALDEGPDSEALPRCIRSGLAASLAETFPDAVAEREERLPLRKAAEELKAFAGLPPVRFLEHLIESWVLGQHVYWSVGRGLGDARARGKNILRLKVVPEEAGWTLAPGASASSPPRATPDRLETAISLMREAGMF